MAENSNFNPYITAGISGTSGIIGSLVGGLFGSYQQKKANEYNQKMLAQQYQYNKQLQDYEYQQNFNMWQMENEYNTPANQMARLRAAGINPHLAYSHGSISNQSASSPTYRAPQYGYAPSAQTDLSGYVRAGHDLLNGVTQSFLNSSLLNSQIDLNKARALEVLARTPGAEADSTLKSARAKFAEQLAGYHVQESAARAANTQFMGSILHSQLGINEAKASQIAALAENIELDNDYKSSTLNDRIYKTTWDLASAYRHFENLKKDGLLKDITYDRISKECRKLDFLHSIGYQSNDWARFVRSLLELLTPGHDSPTSGREKMEEEGVIPMPISPLR